MLNGWSPWVLAGIFIAACLGALHGFGGLIVDRVCEDNGWRSA